VVTAKAYRKNLRWDIPDLNKLKGHTIHKINRRAKYLLLSSQSSEPSQSDSHLIIHLGMSGRFQIESYSNLTETTQQEPLKHEHIRLICQTSSSEYFLVRYIDPRRFGFWLETKNLQSDPLIKSLGPEPLDTQCTGTTLFHLLQKSKSPIKSAIMNQKMLVGVGNIYATEALFKAKIHPEKPSMHLSLGECDTLMKKIKSTLKEAISAGGSSLKDFSSGNQKLGYFQHQHLVYGKAGQDCPQCTTTLLEVKISQRSSVFCPQCQPFS
jgi:formamidopyrimidine-DNA glycosylase